MDVSRILKMLGVHGAQIIDDVLDSVFGLMWVYLVADSLPLRHFVGKATFCSFKRSCMAILSAMRSKVVSGRLKVES